MKALTAKIWLIVLVFSCQPSWAEGDIEEGRKVAELHCSRCHVIGDYNKYGGIGSTPSFQLLVNYLPDYIDRFETFFERRPHPNFVIIDGHERFMDHLPPNATPVKLPHRAVADVLAFVETLKKKK